MAYQSLYRKYRPQRFAELVGQDHVTTALRNAVRDGRVGHAYLFSGPAWHGQDHDRPPPRQGAELHRTAAPTAIRAACARTASAIAEGRSLDVIELDAASNNGVEEMRDLIESVHLGLGADGATRCTSSTRCTCSAPARRTRC